MLFYILSLCLPNPKEDQLEIYSNMVDANREAYNRMEAEIESFNNRYEAAASKVVNSYSDQASEDIKTDYQLIQTITKQKLKRSKSKIPRVYLDAVMSVVRQTARDFPLPKEELKDQIKRLQAILQELQSKEPSPTELQKIATIKVMLLDKSKILRSQGEAMSINDEVQVLEQQLLKYQKDIEQMKKELENMKSIYLKYSLKFQ